VSSTDVVPTAATPLAASASRPRTLRRRNRRKLLARVATNVIALLVLVVMLFPVYWMVATAFKRGNDILSYSPKWFPIPGTLSNFTDAIHRDFFWSDVKNSLIIVSAVVTVSIVLAFLSAVALAKFRFYGRRPMIVLMIFVQMIPLNALIIPIYILLARAGTGGPFSRFGVNTLGGVIVTYMTFVLPFTVWTLRGFVLGVPKDLEEAAMVDGSTRVGAFIRIFLPLVAPGLVATSIFAFIQAWNEFIFAYVLLSSPEKHTLQIWLADFTTSRGTDWGPLMAGATLTALPVVVFFALISRKIAFGLTTGAVRG
jgi:N,N'-diacetylchitobiose transport system permease protein